MKKLTKKDIKNTFNLRLESSLKRIRESSEHYGKIDTITSETFLSFIYTNNHVSSYLDKIVRTYRITRSGINVLTILRSCEGKKCNQQNLSHLLLVSRANVTGLVDGLIRKNLVHRMPDANDRRACVIKITGKGEQLLDSILPKYHEEISSIFSGLKKADKEVFKEIMGRLSSNIDNLEKQKTK